MDSYNSYYCGSLRNLSWVFLEDGECWDENITVTAAAEAGCSRLGILLSITGYILGM